MLTHLSLNLVAGLAAGLSTIGVTYATASTETKQARYIRITSTLVPFSIMALLVPPSLPDWRSSLIGAAVPLGMWVGLALAHINDKLQFGKAAKKRFLKQ